MKLIPKVTGYNLLAILVYSACIRLASGGDSMSILIFSAFAVGIHAIIGIVISLGFFASRNKELGRAWLLSTLIVLLVGFSTCLGNASLGTSNARRIGSLPTYTPSSPPPSVA